MNVRPKLTTVCVFLLGTMLLLSTMLLSSCAPMKNQSSSPDYEETKKMVIDILQTEDGKKAIQEVLSEKETKQKMLMDEPFIQSTIEETLLQDDNKKQWQTFMASPEFASKYAKQMEDQHKKLIKDLMKDPDYQKSMMDILQDPEMEKQILQMTKSTEFKKQTMNVIKEAMQSPHFRLELLELLKQISIEETKDQNEQQDGGKNDQGQSQGTDGGGGGGGGSGGGGP